MRAAIVRAIGDPELDVVDDAELVPVTAGTVRVAIRATGVCHSDLEAMRGTYGIPTPCVLGHEGVGEVVEVGDGVTDLAIGDHVLATGVIQCGRCGFCRSGQGHLCVEASFVQPYFRVGGEPVFALAGIGSFSEEVLLARQAAVKIPTDVPWDAACFVGCGVTTGVGAVLNAAHVSPGSSVVVFGCGGVGTAVIQTARLSGAAIVVAVDPVPAKRERALGFGATHAAAPDDVARLAAELTGDRAGFDFAFEAVGHPDSIRATYDVARRGGTVVIVGVGRKEQPVAFDAYELAYEDKTVRGTWFGSGDPRVDFLRVLDLWRAGLLDLEGMITRRAAIEDVNDVFEDMRTGTGLRTVLTF